MNSNRYTNLVEATNDLHRRGFGQSFRFENNTMIALDDKTSYDAADMEIREVHRFEGYSNPSDNSIVFAVACKDGKKGTIITPYGAYGAPEMDAFMKKVKEVPSKQKVDFVERTKGTSRK